MPIFLWSVVVSHSMTRPPRGAGVVSSARTSVTATACLLAHHDPGAFTMKTPDIAGPCTSHWK